MKHRKPNESVFPNTNATCYKHCHWPVGTSVFVFGCIRVGGFSHWHGINTCIHACLLGYFFMKFLWRLLSFHQKQKSPNYINWVYFEQIIVKNILFRQNWVLNFLLKKVYRWVGEKLVQRKFNLRGPAGMSTYNFGKSNPHSSTGNLQ